MELPKEEVVQLGTVALLFLVAIKEFFAYLRSMSQAKVGGDNGPAILSELKRMNDNHLHTIQESNERLVDTLHSGQTKMIEILGRIEGGINSRR